MTDLCHTRGQGDIINHLIPTKAHSPKKQPDNFDEVFQARG